MEKESNVAIKDTFNLGKGWYLMIVAILAIFVSNAGVNDGLNVALPAISKGANLDYEVCLSMGTVAGFVAAVTLFFIAKLRDKFGGRNVASALFIINGLAFYFLFLRADSIFMYGLAQCIMVSCGQGAFYLCLGPMQARWFPKKRGVINGMSNVGANLGTSFLVPIMTFLISIVDYQIGLSVFAIISIALGVFVYIFLRDNPLEAGFYPDNVSKEIYESEYKEISKNYAYVSDWTMKRILTTKETWFVAMIPGFIMVGLIGIITQFLKRNLALGLSMNEAITAMFICGFLGILGSYSVGYIDTKIGTKRVAMFYCAYFALAIFCNLIASYIPALVYLSIFMVGTSLGGATMLLSYPASIFGVLDYPKVNGVIFPISYCIGCLNFVINAVVLKITGSLTGAYIIYMCLFLFNILLIAFVEEGKWDKLKHPELHPVKN